MVEVLTLHLLLIRLAMVEVVEVADDDRYRKCNREHTGNRTQRPDDLTPHTDRPEEKERDVRPEVARPKAKETQNDPFVSLKRFFVVASFLWLQLRLSPFQKQNICLNGAVEMCVLMAED